MNPVLISDAMKLASKGFYVFPVKVTEKDKVPLIKEWQNKATKTIGELPLMFEEAPNATHIGIATGLSNLVVIDVDLPNGLESLERLSRTHGPLPPTLFQRTLSGGIHYVFNANEKFKIGNSQGRIGKDLDVRGDGGFIVYYGWDDNLEPQLCNPLYYYRMITNKYGLAALDGETEKLIISPNGQRNGQLNEAAIKLSHKVVEGIVDETYVRTVLLISGKNIGLTEQECKATIESGISAGKKQAAESNLNQDREASNNFKVISFSEVEDEIEEWYEESWIPKYGLMGIVGKTGVGKTTCVMGMLAQLTNDHGIEVAYLTTEGSMSRLKAQMRIHSIDTSKIRTILGQGKKGKYNQRAIVITESMIRQLQQQYPLTKAIVVDPAVVFFDIDDERASSKDIRDKLTEFDELGSELKLLLIFIKHQKKDQIGTASLSTLDKMHGSGTWSQVPRICHAIIQLNDKLRGDDTLLQDPASHLLLNVKISNSKMPGAKVLEMAEVFDEPTQAKIQFFKVLGIQSNITEDRIIEVSTETKKESKDRIIEQDWQKQWLVNYLLDKPSGMNSKDIVEAAKKEKIPQATLYRRRKELEIEGGLISYDGVWMLTESMRKASPPPM